VAGPSPLSQHEKHPLARAVDGTIADIQVADVGELIDGLRCPCQDLIEIGYGEQARSSALLGQVKSRLRRIFLNTASTEERGI